MSERDHTTRRPLLFRLRALRAEYGNAPSTTWKQVGLGLWPPPIRLTGKSVAFVVAECDLVIQARIRGLGDDAIKQLVKTLVAARKTAGVEASVSTREADTQQAAVGETRGPARGGRRRRAPDPHAQDVARVD